MQHPLDALATSYGLLRLCLRGEGGTGWVWVAALMALAVACCRWTDPVARPRLWRLTALPAIWVFPALWGGAFLADQGPPGSGGPDWVVWPAYAGLPAFLLLSAVLVFVLRGARTFAALFALANLYLVAAMSLAAGMAVTGVWL